MNGSFIIYAQLMDSYVEKKDILYPYNLRVEFVVPFLLISFPRHKSYIRFFEMTMISQFQFNYAYHKIRSFYTFEKTPTQIIPTICID